MLELMIYLMILGLYATLGLAVAILVQGIIYWTTRVQHMGVFNKKICKERGIK